MRLGLAFGAAAALSILMVAPAIASGPAPGGFQLNIQFGRPDYSNYLSRPGVVDCDWQYPNYFRACPTPHLPPKPAAALPTVK